MTTRMRYAVVLLLALVALAVVGRRLLNNIVYSTSGSRVVSFTWQDTAAQKGKTSYYYVRGLQQPQAGESGGQIVWASPMWVTIQ